MKVSRGPSVSLGLIFVEMTPYLHVCKNDLEGLSMCRLLGLNGDTDSEGRPGECAFLQVHM
jgi:hypothetical protein